MMRVQAEMANIDRDGSGTIDRIEFIGYLLSPDSKGSSYFDFELRKAFEKYNSNKDGYLDAGELVHFLTF
jgi:Ca2+-binding EF-hand superfamily protein